MCTVSWSRTRDGYELFFNRDELNTRAPEQPPALAALEGMHFLAPRDGDHGGTWLLVNEWGVTICLLNDYACAWRPATDVPRYSRGHLVLACAGATDHAGVFAAVSRAPLSRTPAFHLVVLTPDEGPLVLHWNGTQLARVASPRFGPVFTSSSYATAEVVALRTLRFGSFVRTPAAPHVDELAAYHHQHVRGGGAHSVLMRRTDAATRSIIHVSVGSGSAILHYTPVRWAQQGPVLLQATHTLLPRRRSATKAA